MGKTSRRTILRYTLMQLPALAGVILALLLLSTWICVPLWLMVLVISAWITKDAVLYFLTWRAYDAEGTALRLAGKTGTAKERLAPSGYIAVYGELWRAEIMDRKAPVEAGSEVRIRRANGLTLLVEPEKDGNKAGRNLGRE